MAKTPYEPKIWVMEWLSAYRNEWIPIQGDTELRRARLVMRNWRAVKKQQNTRDKFRIVKYVRNTEGK